MREMYKGTPALPPRFTNEIIIDSGGFQLASGVFEVYLKAYALWLELLLSKYNNITGYFNLDVIGDALKTFENQLYLESEGLHPIPTFHDGEPQEYLDFYCKHYPWVSIGGLMSKSKSGKGYLLKLTNWLLQTYPDTKFHLFGVGISGVKAFKQMRPYCLADSCNKVYHYDSAPTLPSKVKVGDKLIGFDGQKFIPTTVKETSTRVVTELLQVTYKRDGIRDKQILDKVLVTLEHPFYTTTRGWVEARELQVGDELFIYHPIWYRKLKGSQRKPPTLETRRKIGQSILANEELMAYLHSRPSPMHRPEVADKVRQKLKGRKTGCRIPDKNKRMELVRKGWETRNRGPSSFSRRPSSLEVLVMKIAQQYSLPIEYVRNAKLPIGNMTDRRYPDFKVIGRNKVIESFDNRWPPRKDNYQSELFEHYKKYGWDCLMLDVCNKSNDKIAKEISLFCSNGAIVTKINRITGKTRGRRLSYPFKVYNFYCEPANNFVLNYVLTHNSSDFSTWSTSMRFGNAIIKDSKQIIKEVPMSEKDRLRVRTDHEFSKYITRENIKNIKYFEETINSYKDTPHQLILH